MAWTYFTTYLDGTRPITKNERDELYDQFVLKLGCPNRYSLTAATMTAIKASELETDLASLHDSVAGTDTLGNLASTIDACSAAFSNLTTAKTNALSDEGITSTDRTNIIASGLSDYHLWNYYKRLIDYLTPLSAPASTLVKRSASASLSKCGFAEYIPSTPPKKYLVKTKSGDVTSKIWAGLGSPSCDDSAPPCQQKWVWTGSITYTRPACTSVDTTLASVTNISCPGSGYGSCAADVVLGTVTATTTNYNAANTCIASGCTGGLGDYKSYTGTLTETLSSEYTTATLDSDVTAALPSFSGSFTAASPTATYDISTDENTISKSKAEYKFTLPTLTGFVAGGYKLDWIERFTPEGGGSPTDTAKSYTWNGTDTETGVYTLSVPGSQGTTSIVSVVASCL